MKYFKIAFIIVVIFFGGLQILSWLYDSKASASKEPEQTNPATSAPSSEAVTASDPQDFDKMAASDITEAQLSPEDIFEFKYETPACLNRDDLQAISYHILHNELTKANSYIFSKSNPNGTCFMVDINKQYKVISAEYNNPDDPEIGLIEFVGKNVKSAKEGAWAFTAGAWKVD